MRKVPKTSFLGHFGPFLTVFRKITENDGKYQKSAWYNFLPLNVPYFMPNFRKIVGAVSEIIRDGRTNGRTDGRTNGGYFIGPFGFQLGTKNQKNFRFRLFRYGTTRNIEIF